MYFPYDADFLIFKRTYTEIISPNTFTKLLRRTRRLIDVLTYPKFKDITLKRHKEVLLPGIEKTIS